MKRETLIVALLGLVVAVFAGALAGELGILALIGLLGLGIGVGAFFDLRVTLMALVPAMILLPELPLAIPVRTEDLLMVPLAGAWLARLAMGHVTWPKTPLNAPLFTVLGVELLATLWGAFRGSAEFGPELYSASFFFLKSVEVAFLYFIVVSAVRSRNDARTFGYVLCAAAAVLGVWGVIEHATLPPGEAITGPTGHGGYSLLGLTFVVLLSTMVSLTLTDESWTARGLLTVASLPVAYSLIFTLSRQSYVGAVTALLVLLWFRDRRLLIPALALAAVIPVLVPGVVEQRALGIVGAPDPLTGRSPYATRLNALQLRFPEVAMESPLLGFGLAALPPGFLDNQYLLTFYYTGAVGLIAFLWLLWRTFRTARRACGDLDGGLRGLGLAWIAATVGLAVAGVAGSPFVAVRVRQVFWFLAGLTVAAMKIVGDRGRAREREIAGAPESAVEAAS